MVRNRLFLMSWDQNIYLQWKKLELQKIVIQIPWSLYVPRLNIKERMTVFSSRLNSSTLYIIQVSQNCFPMVWCSWTTLSLMKVYRKINIIYFQTQPKLRIPVCSFRELSRRFSWGTTTSIIWCNIRVTIG